MSAAAASAVCKERGLPAARTVMVIDDDPITGRLVGEMVASAGFAATYAESVAQCLGALDALPAAEMPAALIVDIFMPGRDAFDLMRALAARRCELPLIVISGGGQDYLSIAGEFGRLWGLSILDLLPKPIETRRLLPHLAALGGAGTA